MSVPPPTPPSGKGRPRGSGGFAWRAFFHHSTTPLFVLGKSRRLRYANPAWEALTGVKLSEALGMVCSTRRHSTPLAAALAPTPEALAGRPDRARKPAPPGRNGPPWWDVQFVPLAGAEGLYGIVGFVAVVGEPVPAAARRVPPGVAALRDRHASHYSLDLLAGGSLAVSLAAARLVSQARLAASLTAPVWIVGEPGSGKETVARVIHHTSAARDRAFVAVDCGGLQPYLIESLLFGHGGLSESDRVGTVYLKEPTALPRDAQQRLADHFTEHPGTRLMCGSEWTAQDEALVPAFQVDLSAFELRVPPLRDRLGDLPRLAMRTVNRAIDPAALAVLLAHTWPNNLRELTEVLTEAASASATGPILREHLPHDLRVNAELPRAGPPKALNLEATLEAVEKRLIQLALKKANGHQTAAAELLGVFRARLWRRLDALGIPVPPQPPKPRKDE